MTQDDILKDLNAQIINDLYKKCYQLFPEIKTIDIARDYKSGKITINGLTESQGELLMNSFECDV